MTAVLSLNGKPQAMLRCVDGAFSVEEQLDSASTDKRTPIAVGAATQQVMQVLGSLARVQISDGRIILGRLHCFDKHQNVILTDAREFPPLFGRPLEKPKTKQHNNNNNNSNDSNTPVVSAKEESAAFEAHRASATSRSLGMTLVPGKHIVYIKVHN